MKKPAIKTDRIPIKVLPENKLSKLDNTALENSQSSSALENQKVSVDPVRADLIWLGRYPLIDSHKYQ